MGLFGKKSVHCPGGEWSTLISNFGSGLPAWWTIRFTAEGGTPVNGIYIEKRCWWIFPQPPVSGPIDAEMRFHRYWINAIYSIRVCPEIDCAAEIS